MNKTLTKIVALYVLFLFLFSFLTMNVSAEENVIVEVTVLHENYGSGNPIVVQEGNTFEVEIIMNDGGHDIIAWKIYEFSFTQGLANIVSLEIPEGSFWYNTDFKEVGDYDNTQCKIENAQAFSTTGTQEASGNSSETVNTTLLKITFETYNEGLLYLNLNSFKVQNYKAEEIGFTIISNAAIEIESDEEDPPNGGGGGGSGGGGGGGNPPPPPTDSDGDGVPDTEDICPGHDDNIDTDNDTIPDGCDDTPNGTEPPSNVTENIPPVAETNGPYEFCLNESALFNADGSYDEDGNVVLYEWYFEGIGNFIGLTTGQIFTEVGTYNITLVVTDNNGSNATDYTYVVINECKEPPVNDTTDDIKDTAKVDYILAGKLIIVIGFISFAIILYLRHISKKKDE